MLLVVKKDSDGIPNVCACGKKNSIDHSLVCKKGGYVSMRHNALRNTEGILMREVCKDVQIEPVLIPTETDLQNGTNMAERARLDISARGIFSQNFFRCQGYSSNCGVQQRKRYWSDI